MTEVRAKVAHYSGSRRWCRPTCMPAARPPITGSDGRRRPRRRPRAPGTAQVRTRGAALQTPVTVPSRAAGPIIDTTRSIREHMDTTFVRAQYLDALLRRHLRAFLGTVEADALGLLLHPVKGVELAGGETLMSQGEPGDAMYLVVSGRLRTYIGDDEGRQRMVREITRGQVVGEMSLYTDEPRSATLVAIRDTVLVRLGKAEFKRFLSISGQASTALTRQIIQRLQTEGSRSSMDRPVTIGLLPVTEGADLNGFAAALAEQLRSIGRVAVIDAALLDAELGAPGITHRERHDAETNRSIAVRLDEIEAEHDFVLLLSDATPTSWTHRCSRHCDELY